MQTMQKHFFNFVRWRTSSFNAANPNHKTLSVGSFELHNFYTSESGSSSNSHISENEIHDDNPADVDDVSSEDLKNQIDKFYMGDYEAIPAIFESILKRKLAGTHQDSDDELMNEFRKGQPNEIVNEDFDLSSSSDIDSDSDK
ncbi:hypothetical protein R6Q59_006997 [Mikania micrantha]